MGWACLVSTFDFWPKPRNVRGLLYVPSLLPVSSNRTFLFAPNASEHCTGKALSHPLVCLNIGLVGTRFFASPKF